MFKGCDIYLYNGLLLDEEVCEKLRIKMATKPQMIALLDGRKTVIKLNDKGVTYAETPAIKQEIMNNVTQDIYFYIDRDYFILPSVNIYYGICMDNGIISVYKERQIRDAKLYHANVMGFPALFEDVKENQEVVCGVNSQLQLYKSYRQLQYYSRKKQDYLSSGKI